MELFGYYEKYEFYLVVVKLQMYCLEDFGGFYFDVLKDCLYMSVVDLCVCCFVQIVLYYLMYGLLCVFVLFLLFMVEEVWKVFQLVSDMIFMEIYYVYLEVVGLVVLIDKWVLLCDVCGNVMKVFEEVCIVNCIGLLLQVEVIVYVSGVCYDVLMSFGDDLKFVLIMLVVMVVKVDDEVQESVDVVVLKYQKCECCWYYCEDVGVYVDYLMLCGCCFLNLFENGEIWSVV